MRKSPRDVYDLSMQVVEALTGKEALDLAMRMYDMKDVKVIHSTVTDTKVRLYRALGFCTYCTMSIPYLSRQ